MSDPASDRSTERIEQLLLQILDAPDDRQSEALAAICREEQELAPRLRRRLQELARFGLVTATRDGGIAGVADDAPAPERIGPYRILRTLGRGGMGVVYLADHEQLGRRVAIKCIRAEFLGSTRARERFRRETQAAARLQHPALCTLYEAGEFEGQPYIAMQFVAGETLEQQLRRARALGRGCWSGELSSDDGSKSESGSAPAVGIRRRLRDSVAMIEELARAVHVAHEEGLVHRDLKPANVMVTPEGRPVLLDFGLARDLALEGPGLTQSADVVGTPAYMAPEQVDPRGREVNRATDVHALGAILYECLTLRPPFAGTGREDTYRRILTEEPVELRRLQPAAGRDLASVVHKALAKEPSRRFHSALELADELARVLRGEPTHTRPSGPLGRTWAWAKRQPMVAGSLLALFISLAAGLSAAIWLLRDASAANKTYAAREIVARDPAAAALLAAEALDLGGGEPARSALYEALTSLRLVQAWPLLNTADAVAATPDGSILAAALFCGANDSESTVHLYRDGVERQIVSIGRPRVLQLDQERDRILVVGHLPTARLFDLNGDRIADVSGQPDDVMQLQKEKSPEEQIPFGLIAGGIQGTDIYTVTRDGQVRIFDLNGVCRADRSFHASAPVSGWISADRDPQTGMVALGGKDGSVALWTGAGEEAWHRPIHDGPSCFVAFAPDGRSLLSSCGWRLHWAPIDGNGMPNDFTATVLRLDGATRVSLRGHTRCITSASWSPDGRFVLTTSRDRTARIWSVNQLDSEKPVPCQVLSHEKEVDGGRFCSDGSRILTSMTSGEAVVWDRSGSRLTAQRGHGSGAFCGAVIGGGDRVLTGAMNKRLLLWDTRSRWCGEWQTSAPLTFAGFDLDGVTAWTVSDAGRVQWWTPDRHDPVVVVDLAPSLEPDEHVRTGACWRERATLIVGTTHERILAVARSGDVTVIRAPDRSVGPRTDPLTNIYQLFPDRDRLLFNIGVRSIALRSGALERCITFRRRHVESGPEVDEGILCAAWIPDGSGFAVGTDGQRVCFFDANGKRCDLPVADLGSSVMGLAWESSAKSLFATTRDGLVYRVDRSGAETRLADLGSQLPRIAVTPDGAWLAVSCGDCSVRILDRSGRLHLTLPPLRDWIRCIALSADGRRLLAASDDGDLRMWTLELARSGREILASSPYQAALRGARRAAH